MYILNRISRLVSLVVLLVICISFSGIAQQKSSSAKRLQTSGKDSVFMADPTIFYNEGTYYLYGTGARDGFLVYTSKDMKDWRGPAGPRNGYALIKGDAYGTSGFWAPQVFKAGSEFYMAYTANEHIAIAKSKSPLGPFTQDSFKTISGTSRQIDPFVFKDDDGKIYLYHVRVENGNRLFVAEMKSDLSDIKPETVKECLSATESWENTANATWPVAEGPTVLKHNKLYYLFYSANDFRNPDYAVGYAVSASPYGPWKKFSGNPVISRHTTGQNGTGHGDFVKDQKGNLWYVLHTHFSEDKVAPRRTAVVKGKFVKDKMVIDASSFYFLSLQNP